MLTASYLTKALHVLSLTILGTFDKASGHCSVLRCQAPIGASVHIIVLPLTLYRALWKTIARHCTR